MYSLEEKIRDKSAKVGIVGIGYVGLPLAVAFAEAGFKTLGFDVLRERVDLVNRGQSYIVDMDDARLTKIVKGKSLEATGDQRRLKEVDAIFLCVPTPLTKTKQPDLSFVVHEAEEISKCLQRGQLIILESTTYPGTTREVVLPILERSGLSVGRDFYLAYSPERIDPGNKKFKLRSIAKIVGGMDAQSDNLAELLYRQVFDTVIRVSSPEVAEMTKIFENVFRNVNAALVNEVALLCEKMGISVWEVIDAASTKPFGYMPFYPGPGLGGHCIPLDPYFLVDKAREYDFHARFVEFAADINERMPGHVLSRIMEALNTRGISLNGARVLVLGVTYKKDVGDLRESPCLKLIELLHNRGAVLSYNDPYIPNIDPAQNAIARDIMPSVREALTSVDLNEECLSSVDCVVIATDHSSYDLERIVDSAKLVFDARGATRKLPNCSKLFRLGEQERVSRNGGVRLKVGEKVL